MAEVLLRVVDKTNPNDPTADRLCTKAGDVIVVQEDGWPWGAAELTNPEWRIVKLPGVAASAIRNLIDPDVDANGNLLRKRLRYIDVSIAQVKALIQSGQVITLTPAQITFVRNQIKQKAALAVVVG